MVSELPLSGDSLNHNFLIENIPPIAPGDEPDLETRSVMGDYFKVMQIPLKSGRDFGSQDFVDHAPLVGIANQSFVNQYFQNEDPIWQAHSLGQRSRFALDDDCWCGG